MNFDQIIELISNNPKIMERPIITNKTAGIIGRPPELVKNSFSKEFHVLLLLFQFLQLQCN